MIGAGAIPERPAVRFGRRGVRGRPFFVKREVQFPSNGRPGTILLDAIETLTREHSSMSMQTPTSTLTPGLLLAGLSGNWWLILIRGIAALVFGLLALFWPGITLVTLVLLYGAFALVDGVFALGAAIVGRVSATPRWWLAIVGLLGIAAGALTFAWPGITALVLLFFIAGWSIAIGAFQIIGAIQLRKEIDNEWLLILSGALSVLFGLALFFWPGAGAMALIWLIALYAIVFGILIIAFAFRLRRQKTRTTA
ncbi:MAG: HdeD family acid-resistance protein [Hyphomicrobium sp.]|uniref:HdeD family acid-resistance protein n=1 Tax=Hyphomicrobium sp. TaxID=82 RepID=UPI003D13048F